MPDRARPGQTTDAPATTKYSATLEKHHLGPMLKMGDGRLNIAGLSLVTAVIVIILSVVLHGFNAPGAAQPQAATTSKG
jgi:hypothetical protein